MKSLQAGILLEIILSVLCMDQLTITYMWNQLDYQYPSGDQRQKDLDSRDFVPANNIPMGLEVYKNRLFLTVPRWKHGVPSSLNYINLSDGEQKTPKLNPYPNWAAHSMTNGNLSSTELVSPFRVRADRCGRLWVIDSGKIDILEDTAYSVPPAILVYSLDTDSLLRKYKIPGSQVKEDSFFANIAVEDVSCDDTYAYVADVSKPGLIVYSWAADESWRVSHHYFHPDPLACEFNILGLNFTWEDGIFGLGLSAPRADNYSTLYFHPMASYNEFAVSTEVLRNKSAGDAAFKEFKLLGSRGPNAQSSVSFLDRDTGVLFYSLLNLNAVACWRTTNKEYNIKSQGRIYMNNEMMISPSDIKVDYDKRLWVLSNRMPFFMYGSLDPNNTNFRVFSARVIDAISHTACDIAPRDDILDMYAGNIKNQTINSAMPTTFSVLVVTFFGIIAVMF